MIVKQATGDLSRQFSNRRDLNLRSNLRFYEISLKMTKTLNNDINYRDTRVIRDRFENVESEVKDG